jgi:hypothetical protein
MTTPEPRSASRLPLIVGVAAVAGGLWLFLNALGVGVPPFKRLWPILFVLAGVAAWVDLAVLSRRPSSAGWGLAFVGLGALFFALTLGYTGMGRALDWLPSLPTIVGLALVATWLADRRRQGNLMVAGVILVVLGLLGFGARFDWLQRILPSAQVVWAALFVIGGGYLVWRAVARSRG